jgi:hypothetical protein
MSRRFALSNSVRAAETSAARTEKSSANQETAARTEKSSATQREAEGEHGVIGG